MSNTYDQLKSITGNLNAYFVALAEFLDDPTKPVPSFEDYSDMEYDAIYTDALQGFDTASSYALGATTDMVHMAIAVNREFGMRAKGKTEYYSDSVPDTETVAELYNDIYARYLNFFRGTSPEENRSS